VNEDSNISYMSTNSTILVTSKNAVIMNFEIKIHYARIRAVDDFNVLYCIQL